MVRMRILLIRLSVRYFELAAAATTSHTLRSFKQHELSRTEYPGVIIPAPM